MTLFEIILKISVVKIIKISGLTARYTYIRIYIVYLDNNLRVVSAAGVFF